MEIQAEGQKMHGRTDGNFFTLKNIKVPKQNIPIKLKKTKKVWKFVFAINKPTLLFENFASL